MITVSLIGSGAAQPTSERGASATLIQRGTKRILVDCGEGTTRELMKLGRARVSDVLITHGHLDHIGGLHGLLRSMELGGGGTLTIYAPLGAMGGVSRMLDMVEAVKTKVCTVAMEAGEEVVVQGMAVRSWGTIHEVPSLGYRITEPMEAPRIDLLKCSELGIIVGPMIGALRKSGGLLIGGRTVKYEDILRPAQNGVSVAVSGDTTYSKDTIDAVNGVDLLIHEATYRDAESGLAREHHHSTALEVGNIAREAGVGGLLLTHFSARYKPEEIEALRLEAAAACPGVVVTTASDGYYVDVAPKCHVDIDVVKATTRGT